MTVIHAVSELVPAVIGRGGYPFSKYQDRFSIKNVENDERGGLMSGMRRKRNPGCQKRKEGRSSVFKTHHVHDLSDTV